MLLIKVKTTITRYSLISPGDRIVVAVSGGPDSVCLLAVLHALAGEFDLSLHVAHLDHSFRGEESARDALFTSELAKQLGIDCTIDKIDVPAYCRKRGLSAQAGAREVRYAFLDRVMAEEGAARIATGHTATDQAETFLMRMIRGAGPAGLSAIYPKRGAVIRPLIEATRDEVLEYLTMNRIRFVSDSSNLKPVYMRNRVRMQLLPALAQFNPRIVETLAAEAGLLRDEEDAVETCLEQRAGGIFVKTAEAVFIERRQFNELPLALKRRLLRKAVAAAGAEPSRVPRGQIDEAISFMSEVQTGRNMNLLPGLGLLREYDRFILRHVRESSRFWRVLAVPGITDIPELGLIVETRIEAGGEGPEYDHERPAGETEDYVRENYLWHALFDYDKINSELVVRSRLPGDWFCPEGMKGKRKKLQDFFVDSRTPQRMRDSVPLLATDRDILWVVGLRVDERFRVRTGAKRMISVGIRRIKDRD